MTYAQMLDIAMAQSAVDSNCRKNDFTSGGCKTVISADSPAARKYLKLPFVADITTYGSGVVASVSEEFYEIADRYINSYEPYHLFETPNMHVFSRELRKKGADICFMAEYWLLRDARLPVVTCDFTLRVLSPSEFSHLYLPQWSNALCKERSQLDMIAVGAYDSQGILAGLAGASADCENMWQIGVDVLEKYRRCGIASALTSRLAHEIISLGKVPFYCCAWSNVASARNAVKSGFVPAWVSVTAKKLETIEELNKSHLFV